MAAPAYIPAPVEALEADEPVAATETAREGRPRRGRERNREPNRDRDRKDGRNRRGERQPGDPQGGDEKFKGMGDHVPAFLLRSLRPREDA
jgi:ATP-dependent RNA helicase RhlE